MSGTLEVKMTPEEKEKFFVQRKAAEAYFGTPNETATEADIEKIKLAIEERAEIKRAAEEKMVKLREEIAIEKEATNRQLEAVVKFFRSKGISVSIGGCGCCDSPWIKIVDDDTGETVCDTIGKNIEMLEE